MADTKTTDERIADLESKVADITAKHNALAADFSKLVQTLKGDRRPPPQSARY